MQTTGGRVVLAASCQGPCLGPLQLHVSNRVFWASALTLRRFSVIVFYRHVLQTQFAPFWAKSMWSRALLLLVSLCLLFLTTFHFQATVVLAACDLYPLCRSVLMSGHPELVEACYRRSIDGLSANVFSRICTAGLCECHGPSADCSQRWALVDRTLTHHPTLPLMMTQSKPKV